MSSEGANKGKPACGQCTDPGRDGKSGRDQAAARERDPSTHGLAGRRSDGRERC